MKKIAFLLCLFVFTLVVHAQDNKWALGFYGDAQLKSPNYGSFGIQGKYDFALHHGVQAAVNGRKDFVSVGADYILNVLNKKTNSWNVFTGVGVAQDFYRREVISTGGVTDVFRDEYENFTKLNAQLGVSYYVPDVALSVFVGYKLRTDIDFSDIEPNFVTFGLRYHLW